MIDDKLIRINEVCETTSLSKSKIYAMVKDGQFPAQTRLSHRVAAWRASEVRAWMNGVAPGGSQDEELLV